jgi:hypothetical protein
MDVLFFFACVLALFALASWAAGVDSRYDRYGDAATRFLTTIHH